MQKHLDCGRLIKQIHDEMGKRANNALRSQDMTVVQLEALIQLDAAPEKRCSLKELERQLHVAQSTTVGIIARPGWIAWKHQRRAETRQKQHFSPRLQRRKKKSFMYY